MELYLFRHGYTQFNIEHRYQGTTDLPLIDSEHVRIKPVDLSPKCVFEDRESGIYSGTYSGSHFGKYSGKDSGSHSGTYSGSNSGTDNTNDPVYVSPALRAGQTAGLLFPGREQIVVPEFAEMDFGIFEGRSADEMKADVQYRRWVDSMCEDRVPMGESKANYTKRVTDQFQRIVCEALDRGSRSLLIVAHGGTQMAVMERFCEENRPYWTWQTKPAEGIRAGIILS